MTARSICNVEGSHLTTTDKRNIRAVLSVQGFEPGRIYQVNGRKSYAVMSASGKPFASTGPGDRLTVRIYWQESDSWGRKLDRSASATFEVKS